MKCDFQFTKQYRILKPDDFNRVFSYSRKKRDHYFTLFYCNNNKANPRLGLSITKKKINKAVDRNRIKRIIRESFRAFRIRLPEIDIIVTCNSINPAIQNKKLFQSLSKQLHSLIAEESSNG